MKLICKEACSGHKTSLKAKSGTLLSGALVLFMPKCALCWAAYMSLLGSMGLVIRYRPWFLPVAIGLFVLTLMKLLITAVHRKNFLAFSFAVIAGLMILLERNVRELNGTKLFSLVLMTIAVLMKQKTPPQGGAHD